MDISVTITGTFDSDLRASRCLRRVTGLNVPVKDISVLGVTSRRLRLVTTELLKTSLQGKYISIIGISGALCGAVVAWFSAIDGPTTGLLRDLDLFSVITLGLVGGCMLGAVGGALLGSLLTESARVFEEPLSGGRILVAVKVSYLESNEIRAIMQDCGALAIATRNAMVNVALPKSA